MRPDERMPIIVAGSLTMTAMWALTMCAWLESHGGKCPEAFMHIAITAVGALAGALAMPAIKGGAFHGPEPKPPTNPPDGVPPRG